MFAIPAVVRGSRPPHPYTGRLIVPAVVLTVVIGLRFEVGGDWRTYLDILRYVRMTDLQHALQRTEPSFALLNWITAQAGWGVWFPNLVCAAIFTYGLITFAREQPNPWLALVVAVPYLIIGVAMGYTRQSAALGLIMIAFSQLRRGATLRMLFSLALAASFHFSVIVLAPILVLAGLQRGLLTGVMVAVLGILLFLVFSERVVGRAEVYGAGQYTATGAIPRILMNVLPALIFLSFRERFTADRIQLRLWTLFAAVALMTIPLLFFVSSSTVIDRLGIYLVPLQIFVLSRLPNAFGAKGRQNLLMLTGVILYSFAAEVVWLNLGTWSEAWLPYRNYLWEQLLSSSPYV